MGYARMVGSMCTLSKNIVDIYIYFEKGHKCHRPLAKGFMNVHPLHARFFNSYVPNVKEAPTPKKVVKLCLCHTVCVEKNHFGAK